MGSGSLASRCSTGWGCVPDPGIWERPRDSLRPVSSSRGAARLSGSWCVWGSHLAALWPLSLQAGPGLHCSKGGSHPASFWGINNLARDGTGRPLCSGFE